ncbi:MAG: AAA family ATPase, partial [Bacteroidales bacterium]
SYLFETTKEKIDINDRNINSIITEAIEKALKLEFQEQIKNMYYPQEDASINFNGFLNIHLHRDHSIEFSDTDLSAFPFKECYFIDSPFVFQMSEKLDNYIRNKRISLFDNDDSEPVNLHTEHLLAKLKLTKSKTDGPGSDLARRIDEIIHGEIVFNSDKQDFIFKKKTERSDFDISSINTASGIKALGLLGNLISKNVFDRDTLLILDEPENHLHPEWQIRYARIITELVDNGISVMVSSHSPYMMQALRKFSNEKRELVDKTNFYLTRKDANSGCVTLDDVTTNFTSLFKLLNEPFRSIL